MVSVGASLLPSDDGDNDVARTLRRMAMNTLVSVSVFGLVPLPPMPDTLDHWSRPSKMVAKLLEETERGTGWRALFRSARRRPTARDHAAIG
jgi:hypothetical protein